jgi:hypothetical protein
MLKSTRDTRWQSSNMHSQNAFTAWLKTNLAQRNIRKHYAALEAISPPKWLNNLADSPPHASLTSFDV